MEIHTGFDNFSTLDESDMLLYGNMINHIDSHKKPFLKEKESSLIPEFYANNNFQEIKKKSLKKKRKYKYLSTKAKNPKIIHDLKKIKTIKVKTRNSSLKNNKNFKSKNNLNKKKIKNSIKVKKTKKLNLKNSDQKSELWNYIENMEKMNLSLFIKDLSECKIKSLSKKIS